MFHIGSIVLVLTVLTSAGIEGAGDSRRQLVIISLYIYFLNLFLFQKNIDLQSFETCFSHCVKLIHASFKPLRALFPFYSHRVMHNPEV